MLENDVSSLVTILERETESYQELLNLARKEQQIILSGNIDDLALIVGAVENLVLASRELEKERMNLFHSISKSLNISPEAETLSELIEKLAEPDSKNIKASQHKMSRILGKLTEVSRSNAELLERNLNYIDFLFSLMDEEGQIYQEDAKKKTTGAKLFDQKV